MRTIQTTDLDSEIEGLVRQGYRLDMIMPADAPTEALLSRSGESLRLQANPKSKTQNLKSGAGRAGMLYRDLIPDRVGGRVIASHITIVNGGDVPDYVHFHKIRFQMIFCKSGWVRVVYEDQGEPFVLNAGDCVLQPPEIRHRVLEASAGAEVIEVSSPAEHETWVEHDIELPTPGIKLDRVFGGQRFVRHRMEDAEWITDDGGSIVDTGIAAATEGLASAKVIRVARGANLRRDLSDAFVFLFVLSGRVEIKTAAEEAAVLHKEDCYSINNSSGYFAHALDAAEFLEVSLREH